MTAAKKILLAVDGSMHSHAMLDYVAGMWRRVEGLSCTLLHIQKGLPPLLLEEADRDPQVKAQLNKLQTRNADHARRVLDDSRRRLIRTGMPEKAVESLTQKRSLGLARDIILQAETAPYDAIAVGRRGVSGLQKLLMGSLTAKLCEHSAMVPVWVVDGDARPEGVLIAVDGSSNSLRAVDHASFVLGGNPEARVTLLHVVPRFADHCEIDIGDEREPLEAVLMTGDRLCLDRFAASVHQYLEDAGVPREHIDFRQIQRTTGVGRGLIEEARRHRLTTVVIGRSGSGGAFYSGRVCRYVLQKATDTAVWLVP